MVNPRRGWQDVSHGREPVERGTRPEMIEPPQGATRGDVPPPAGAERKGWRLFHGLTPVAIGISPSARASTARGHGCGGFNCEGPRLRRLQLRGATAAGASAMSPSAAPTPGSATPAPPVQAVNASAPVSLADTSTARGVCSRRGWRQSRRLTADAQDSVTHSVACRKVILDNVLSRSRWTRNEVGDRAREQPGTTSWAV